MVCSVCQTMANPSTGQYSVFPRLIALDFINLLAYFLFSSRFRSFVYNLQPERLHNDCENETSVKDNYMKRGAYFIILMLLKTLFYNLVYSNFLCHIKLNKMPVYVDVVNIVAKLLFL